MESAETPVVLVCGGGNAAHVLAGLFGSQASLRCRVLDTFADESVRWTEMLQNKSPLVTVNYDDGKCIQGRPELITNDPAVACKGVTHVIISVPAFAHEVYLSKIVSHLPTGVAIGGMPGLSGFDLVAKAILGDKASTVFTLNDLPWACRIHEYGQEVKVLATKGKVGIAALPKADEEDLCATLGKWLLCPGVFYPMGGFLNSDFYGQVHPPIVYGAFHAWDQKTPFKEIPLFYQNVDGFTEQVLLALSEEVMEIKNTLTARYPALDLSTIVSVDAWIRNCYGDQIKDTSSLKSCFNTNPGYQGLRHQMKSVEGGYVPDPNNRYFCEDVPFGLMVTKGIAELLDIPTPTMDTIITWIQAFIGKQYLIDGKVSGRDVPETRAPQRFGITKIDAFIAPYM